MARIKSLTDIKPDEIQGLKKRKIDTIAELRSCLDDNQPENIFDLAQATGIERGRLIAWMTASFIQSTRWLDYPWLRRLSPSLTGAVLFLLASILLLMARLNVPTWFGEQQQVVLAAYDLHAGQVLEEGDFYTATIPYANDMLSDASQVPGLVLAGDVLHNKPLYRTNLLRLQIVAASDLDTNTLLTRETVRIAWTGFEPNAAVTFDQVLGRRLIQPVKEGANVPLSSLQPEADMVLQVVIASPEELPAFYVIQAGDVQLKATAPNPQAFSDPAAVVGGLLLKTITPGEVLLHDQLLQPADMVDRQIIQLPLAGALGPSMLPGERIWLQFNPIEPGDSTREPLMLRDVILIAGNPTEAAVTVALLDRQLKDVLPNLSAYQVYLIKPVQ